MHIPYHKAMADVHEYGDDPEAVHTYWACRPMGGIPGWIRKYVAIPSSLWPLQVCILPASLPRSDDRPAYTSSEQLKGIQDGQIIGRQIGSSVQWCLERHDIGEYIQPWCQDQSLPDISHQPATMVKYWRGLTVLTTESDQTKAMPHLDLDDPSTTRTPIGKPKRGCE